MTTSSPPKSRQYSSIRIFSLVLPQTLFAAVLLFFMVFAFSVVGAEDESKKQSLHSQLEALEREAAEIDSKLQEVRQEKVTLGREISIIDNDIKRRQIELKRIGLAIRQADIDIVNKSLKIDETVRGVEKNRELLAKNLRRLHAYDQESLVSILAKNTSISSFFFAVNSIRTLQASTEELVQHLRAAKKQLEGEKDELEEFREEQETLKGLREIESRNIASQRAEKDRLLQTTKGKEGVFQNLLSSKKRDIAALKTQLFYLEKTGVTVEEAVKFAELAAERSGIRPAFLLALLEVETGRQFEGEVLTVGTHLGTGHWKADMSPKQHSAFIAITSKLNIDPDGMPVSARPCPKATRERIGPGRPCGYGWGGAMGPAQFIPTTWLLFEDKVSLLTGHNPPDPWNVEDAFTAAAVFLSESGASAKTEAGEIRAAKIYLSGKPNCRTYSCRVYASTILSLASRIERAI